MKNIKDILVLLVILLTMTTSIFIYQWWKNKSTIHTTTSATVLLEKIQKVAKLSTVEGHFSELYENRSFQYWDVLPFQKKVLVRVQAKVAAGFDFKDIKIEADSTHRIIWINDLPQAQLLYIDHDLDYYDISEGLFVSFNEADYNNIQTEAKNLIKQKAEQSALLTEAQKQGTELLDLLKMITSAAGWELKIRSRPALKQ